MSLETQINARSHEVFRRVYIKRRQISDGKFESNWLNITDLVTSYGSFNSEVDGVRFNRFTQSGVDLVVMNQEGKFNPETRSTSLWSGYLTRYRTLVKIEAGYYDTDGTSELPTDTTQGIFIMNQPLPISGDSNEMIARCNSLVSIFDEVTADEVAGLGGTLSASAIIEKIRDHSDGSGNFVFREFITSTAWSIQTTTTNYILATDTSLFNVSVWDLMVKLAECEGFILYISRQGGLNFHDRNPRTTTVAMPLRGLGFPKMNIIRLWDYAENLDKYFNRFVLKYAAADTTTSYVKAGTITAVDPTNIAWKYGAQQYEFENLFFPSATSAQLVVNNLFSMFQTPRNEMMVRAKFLPQVEIGDRVSVSYRSYDMGGDLWDFADFDSDAVWQKDENFDLNAQECVVLSRQTDLDNITTTLKLREV